MIENNENKVNFKVTPEFNFIYELGMPTGKKIRSSLIVGTIFLIASILLLFNKESMNNLESALFFNVDIFFVLKWISIVIIVFSFARAIICSIIQKLSYSHATYTFYDKFMIYEDDFLNQHKKTIQYENIKEVEIRRTIWDRMLGYGIIVIYTNAENKSKNGLVIYSIKNVKDIYEKIEKLVYQNKVNRDNVIVDSKNLSAEAQNENNLSSKQSEEDFKQSLKNIN